MPGETRWLNAVESTAWLELVRVLVTLPATLDAQLRRDSNLNQYEYRVLGVLAEQPSRILGMKSLAVVTNGSLSRLSHVVKRLEAAGYVTRQPNPDDGRLTEAILTDEGLAKVRAAAHGHVEAVRRHVFDHLTTNQVKQLTRLLLRIAPDTELPGNADRC
jgi:DNA-binding MarR family transcriptional regulator